MARVPQFGAWENGDHAPYTVHFENARVGKGGGKPFNPNDPEDNPTAFSRDGRGRGNDVVHDSLQPASKPSDEFKSSEGKVEPQGGQYRPNPSPARYNNKPPTSSSPIPEKGTALPKFGEWDDTPSSGGYTHIFNEVREGRQAGIARIPEPDYYRKPEKRRSKKHCDGSCFGCLFRG